MSVFKVGDRIRRIAPVAIVDEGSRLREGGIYTVSAIGKYGIDLDGITPPYNRKQVGWWDAGSFEPAEVEQASAILDGQQDDGWWDAAPWKGGLLDASGQQTLTQFKRAADRFGLEVRVQVRRVQS